MGMITFPQGLCSNHVSYSGYQPLSPLFWKTPELWVGDQWSLIGTDQEGMVNAGPTSSQKLLRGSDIFLTVLAWLRGGHRTQAWENDLLPRLVKSRLEIKEWKKCMKSTDFYELFLLPKQLLLVSNPTPRMAWNLLFSIFSLVSPFIDFFVFWPSWDVTDI